MFKDRGITLGRSSCSWRNVTAAYNPNRFPSLASLGAGSSVLRCLKVFFLTHFIHYGFFFFMCPIGESGLGKSTLVNSLFLTDLYKDRKLLNAEGK